MTQACERPDYATPYRVEVYDVRVLILCRDGSSICEVMPGQVNGYQSTKAERIAIAENLVEAINARFGTDYSPPWISRQMERAQQLRQPPSEPARSPDAPWLDTYGYLHNSG